jgi:hypothetical protein
MSIRSDDECRGWSAVVETMYIVCTEDMLVTTQAVQRLG